MGPEVATDERSPEVARLHRQLAASTLELGNLVLPEQGAVLPEDVGAPFEYPIAIGWEGFLFYVKYNIAFYSGGNIVASFDGNAGGVAVGMGIAGGTAFLNYDITSIIGWSARFGGTATAFATYIHLSGMSNENIGDCVGGGLGGGLGAFGGEGKIYAGQ